MEQTVIYFRIVETFRHLVGRLFAVYFTILMKYSNVVARLSQSTSSQAQRGQYDAIGVNRDVRRPSFQISPGWKKGC